MQKKEGCGKLQKKRLWDRIKAFGLDKWNLDIIIIRARTMKQDTGDKLSFTTAGNMVLTLGWS